MRLLWFTVPAIVVALTQTIVGEVLRPLPELSAPAPNARPVEVAALLDLARVRRALGLAAETLARPPPTPRPSVRVLGTLGGAEPLAAVEAASVKHAVTLGVGSTIDGWTVAAIDHGRIMLELRDERFELGGSGVRAPGPAQAPVVELAGNHRRLSRTELERASVELAPLIARTTRIMPRYSDRGGVLTGFSISFPPDSPLRQLGLEPNDVVRTLNGQPVTMQLALELASRWTSLSHLEVGLDRGGQPTTLVLDAD